MDWDSLKKQCYNCHKCSLAQKRNNVVFGEGNPKAKLMFVGEGPGADEDSTGRPFVGRAGQLLTKAIEAIGLKREDVYIANVVKCRPPGNRVPAPDEAETCIQYLRNQVLLIKPKIIVCLGATAMKYIIDSQAQISKVRGEWIERKGYWLMPTFHPAALLRDESKKIPFWEDFKKVREKLELLDSE
ncbi:MAG: Uracil glycosylase superfamily protein [Clostridia bacterium]|jgi:DNA polymerase|uniref:uracil-DNA glycosylase n=1 Tax=Petroclostridium xylanilyticum TaxID=1792311 RepID=UPI000B97D5D8|nr:uracil-DNA glycosylase [Petroclostridium xylanilyticum]MBZ4645850.1 Uracil glycosylase superfamily protein [Clostridia bacterium]